MTHSTLGTSLKNKDETMEDVKSTVKMKSTISKRCGKVIEEKEKLLRVWMQDQHWCIFGSKMHKTHFVRFMNKSDLQIFSQIRTYS